jgi:NifU-like protein involved in Fe-S cluster formation
VTYSTKTKRKIILDNFSHPSYQVELEKITKISNESQVPFFTFHNLIGSCGDTIHLLILVKNNQIENVFFSAQQSCLITISSSNILCSYLKRKKLEEV